MKQLAKTLKDLSQMIIVQLDIITTTTGPVEYRKRRILDVWNTVLSPSSKIVQELDDYGREVVWGYKSMVNKHVADHLSLDDFELYVFAVLTKMARNSKGDWNEKR